jgi:protein TonB
VQPEPIGGYYQLESTTVGPTFDNTLLARRIIYPSLAKRQGKEGIVVLRLFISTSGDIEDIWIVDDPGYGFTEAALAAFEGMQVEPASIKGRPVPVTLLFPVRFTLRN